MKVLENVKNVLMILIIIFVIIPIVFVSSVILFNSFKTPDEVPSFFGWKPFIVLSNSMNPTIESGDLILVREANENEIDKGDIISYLDNDIIITHRVVSIEKNDNSISYITKGDSNKLEDSILVNFDMIEGIYKYKISGLGETLMFIQTPNGMIICLSIPCILLFIIQLRSKNDTKKDPE